MTKKELRKIYKKQRQQLSDFQKESLEETIYKQVFGLDFTSIATVHIFLPIDHQIEVNTYPIIDFLLLKGVSVVVSKSDFLTNTLSHYLFKRTTTLEINSYGIPEPVNAEEVDVKQIDMVFVPLLISDSHNFRVGYGKGFYDRFLSECRKDIQTIGLNFFNPIKSIDDLNQFDVALDRVIHP